MKKFAIILALLLLFASNVYAQLITIGGPNDDQGLSMVQTSDGGFAIAGRTNSFGSGDHDVYVVKLNASGNLEWTKTIGGSNVDIAFSIIQTNDGGYAIAGRTRSFGAGGFDFYVVKLDGSGNLQWTKTIGGSNNDEAYSIIQTSDGGFAIAGMTRSFGAGAWDVYVVKLDGSGNLQWTKTIGGTADDGGRSIIQTSDGGYVIAGMTASTGSSDVYVVKLDASGNVQWSKAIGGSSAEEGFSIIQTNDGGYAVTGYTNGPFGGSTDVYAIKLDASGNLQWAKKVGQPLVDEGGWSIIQTGDGGYAIAGNHRYDVYVVKLDSSGNLEWTKTIQGGLRDDGLSIIQTSDGGYAVAGYTESFGSSGFNRADVLLAKLDANGNIDVGTCGSVGSAGSIGSFGNLSSVNSSVSSGGVVGSGGSVSSGGSVFVCSQFPQFGNLCILKFSDLNGNGVQDSNEVALSNWTVTVKDTSGNVVDTVITQDTAVCVQVPAPGTYVVSEVVQTGWTPTTPNPQTVTVQPGQTVNVAFGNQGRAEICVFKFNDLNGNGTQDSGEPPLPGWSFTVSPAPLPPATSPVTTGPEGRVCFNVTAPGSYTITEQVQSGWTPTTPTTQTVTVQPGQTVTVNVVFGNKQIECVPPPSGMVAWWPLDETSGTTAFDIAGSVANNGTHMNGPMPVPGKVNGALRFDGVDDYVKVPHQPELDFGAGDFSIDAWIKAEPNPAHPIVEKWDAPVGSIPGYSFYLFGGKLTFSWSHTLGVSSVSGGPNIADGQWHHVAVTIRRGSSQGGKLYVDGILVQTFDPKAGTVSNTVDLWIGRSRANPTPISFKGVIDEVELFNRALDSTEIQAIYNAGAAGKCKPQQGQICVVKFEDLDGDEVQDPGEPLLPGWMFNVTDANNNPVGTITTSPPGTPPACLTVAPGTYTVTEQVQPGWTPTTPNPQTVTVQPGQTVNLTFGNQQRFQICGIKWNDLDGDGVKDPNEPGLSGWTIHLIYGTPPSLLQGQVTTDTSGRYCFTDLPPGTYTIYETVQPGWVQTFPPSPGTYTVTVPPSVTNIDFGNKQGVCDREIKKTITPNPAQSGQSVTITLTVTNVGTVECPVVPGVIVADPQPPGMTFNPPVTVSGGGAAGWSCSITGPSGSWPGGLQCTSTSPLLPGAANAVTITFTATVTAPPGGQIENCAEVSNVGDVNQANNKSCVTLQVTGCVAPPANMTAWWPLDETSGTTANDLAGFNNTGTHVNGPMPTPGKVAGALCFDGVNDYVRVPNHPELNVGTGSFTLDVWVRTNWKGPTPGNVVVIVDKRGPAGYSLYLYNSQFTAGKTVPGLQVNNGSSFENHNAVNAPNVADGQWHHIAAVADVGSKRIRIYVDGALVYDQPSNILGQNLDNQSSFYIGRRDPSLGPGPGYFPGCLDELELFKRALSDSEIQAIYKAGSAGKCKGCIEGMKWNDANGNSVKDPGESGLSGWTIQLSGPVNATTTTGAGGTYRVCGLPPGTYTVSEVLQPLWVRTFPPPPGTHTVTLAPNQTVSNINFGNRRAIILSDLVVRNLRVLPPTIPRGGTAVVSFDIVNQGEGEAGPATHQVRLIVGEINILLATVATGLLPAGGSQSFAVPIRIPSEVPVGQARLRIVADSGGTVNESDEGNNIAEIPITIIPGGL
jgi:uncharacterized repeat protein (TIGR01451 family)